MTVKMHPPARRRRQPVAAWMANLQQMVLVLHPRLRQRARAWSTRFLALWRPWSTRFLALWMPLSVHTHN